MALETSMENVRFDAPYVADKEAPGSFRDLVPATALLVIGLTALLIACLFRAEDRGQYMLVFAPWSEPATNIRRISAAGGGLMGVGAFSNVIVAASSAPDFTSSIRKAGAWLAIPAPGLAGCFASSEGSMR